MQRCFSRALVCAPFLLVCAVAAAAQPDVVFGPKQYVLHTGKPQIVTNTFVVNEADRCNGMAAFILSVQNGDASGGTAVSSAAVTLNGIAVLRESDFSPNRTLIEVPVSLEQENSLSVELKGGQPGSSIVLSIRREIDQLLGPAQALVLSKGQDTLRQTYSVTDPASVFTLIVNNGDGNGNRRIAAGSIVLNGNTVVSEKELHRTIGAIRVPVILRAQNSLTVTARGESGATVTVALARLLDTTACGPRVFFTTPEEGAIVADSALVVSGTAMGTPDIGITVNGTAAEIDLSTAGSPQDPFRWTAVVSASPGPVILRAIAVNSAGSKGEASRAVVFAPPAAGVFLRPSHSSGPSPLTVLFHLHVDGDESVTQYELDLDGDGVFEMSSSESPDAPAFTYESPGIRFATLRVRFAGGRSASSSVPIVVQSFATLNTLIQQQWSRFTASLAASNVDAALAQLADSTTRRKYEPGLRLIEPSLPQFAAGLQTIKPIWITGKAAHYLMTRMEGGELHGYHVYFVRDASGVWKVAQF